jgi:hypothetical protein
MSSMGGVASGGRTLAQATDLPPDRGFLTDDPDLAFRKAKAKALIRR